jgi:hypothetical protein
VLCCFYVVLTIVWFFCGVLLRHCSYHRLFCVLFCFCVDLTIVWFVCVVLVQYCSNHRFTIERLSAVCNVPCIFDIFLTLDFCFGFPLFTLSNINKHYKLSVDTSVMVVRGYTNKTRQKDTELIRTFAHNMSNMHGTLHTADNLSIVNYPLKKS